MQCSLAEHPSLSTYRLSQLGSSGFLSFSFYKELKKKKKVDLCFPLSGSWAAGLAGIAPAGISP